jgi:hypothetical protein
MKKLLFLFFVTAFFSQQLSAQQNTYEYLGVIKLNDSAFISYKLDFEELDGIINGYSIADMGGSHETKSNIEGAYDKATNEFTFKELNIVYTKSPFAELDFCLVNFKGKLRNLKKNKAFSGDFKGLYQDNTSCLDGMIIMTNAEKVQQRVVKAQKKILKSKVVRQKVKDKINLKNTLDTLTMSVVKKGENLNVFTKTRNVVISIYDAGKVDDDRINLYVDGELILEDYSILAERKEIPITITKEFTTIKVTALNVGDSAPNTVKVEILDGTSLITTRTSLDTDESAVLTLVKQ